MELRETVDRRLWASLRFAQSEQEHVIATGDALPDWKRVRLLAVVVVG